MGSLSSLVLELQSVDTTKVLYFSLGNIISEVIEAGEIKVLSIFSNIFVFLIILQSKVFS